MTIRRALVIGAAGGVGRATVAALRAVERRRPHRLRGRPGRARPAAAPRLDGRDRLERRGLHGSPLSGGYSGAKRTQMFVADHLQRSADARGLGLRFVALAPRQFIAGTRIGMAAAAAYGAANGESAEAHMARRFPVALDPDGVARAILAIAAGDEHHDASLLTVTAAGIEAP